MFDQFRSGASPIGGRRPMQPPQSMRPMQPTRPMPQASPRPMMPAQAAQAGRGMLAQAMQRPSQPMPQRDMRPQNPRQQDAYDAMTDVQRATAAGDTEWLKGKADWEASRDQLSMRPAGGGGYQPHNPPVDERILIKNQQPPEPAPAPAGPQGMEQWAAAAQIQDPRVAAQVDDRRQQMGQWAMLQGVQQPEPQQPWAMNQGNPAEDRYRQLMAMQAAGGKVRGYR